MSKGWKPLEEYFKETIDDIFRSFSEKNRKHLNAMLRNQTYLWVLQFLEQAQKYRDGEAQKAYTKLLENMELKVVNP